MRYKIIFILHFLLACHFGHAQKFQSRAAVGSFTYLMGAVIIKPGPDWKGYSLPRESKCGLLISSSNGFVFANSTYVGLGLSYARYASYNGVLATLDVNFEMEKQKKRGAFIYMAPGISYFWNQYPRGSRTELFDIGLGVRQQLKKRGPIRISAGVMAMQDNIFFAGRLAYTL